MPVKYSFEQLMRALEGNGDGKKLAKLASQTKIEKFLLAEIMHQGNNRYPLLDFYIEDERYDLTIRTRGTEDCAGPLIEWVEAKMCWSDDLARSLTGHRKEFEYRELMRRDANKQLSKSASIPSSARLTSILFVFHASSPIWRQKYYPGFRNRGELPPAEIEARAGQHARSVIAEALVDRRLIEDFSLVLDDNAKLLVFVFSDEGVRVMDTTSGSLASGQFNADRTAFSPQ